MNSERTYSKTVKVLLASIVLLGFAARLVELHKVDLGMDGGLSLAAAVLGPSTVWQLSASDVHPPLYYLLLSLWVMLVGATPFAAKYLSLIFGVAAIAALFALGRRLHSSRLALIVAALIAVSPVWVASAAAVRDFVAAGLFAVVSSFTFVKVLDAEDSEGTPLLSLHIVHLVATLLATLTSYLNLGVFAAQMLFVALRPASRRYSGRWLGVTVALVSAYSAWLWFPLTSRIGAKASILALRPPSPEIDSLAMLLWDAIRQLAVGDFLSASAWPWVASYLLVLLLGLVFGVRRADMRRWRRTFAGGKPEAFLLLALALALAIDYVVVRFWLHDRLPSRYLVIASPFFLLLVARSLDLMADWRKYAAAVACSGLLVGGAIGMRDFYGRPALPPSVWNPEGMVEYVDSRGDARDGLIFTNLEQAGYYAATSKRSLRWYVVQTGPTYLEGDLEQNIAQVLPAAAADNKALWLVLYMNGYASNAGQIRDWLDHNAYLSKDEWISDGVMRRYVTARGRLWQAAIDADFGNMIRLKDVAFDAAAAAAGDVRLELGWQAIASVSEDYTVFVHFVDEQGKRWGQFDAQPPQPTSRWQADQTHLDRRAVQLADRLPAGTYWFQVGLYLGERRLDLANGDNFVKIGPVLVR